MTAFGDVQFVFSWARHTGGMRILVVEDEPKMAALLELGLRRRGHAVDLLSSGEDAISKAAAVGYDSILLDVMLPGLDGFETCAELRRRDVWAPVLMLTARDAVADRVSGLDAGADDYLVKPFSFAELDARLRALARRGARERPPVLEAGDLRLDPAARRAWRGTTELALSPKEFALLEILLQRVGEAVSRFELLEHAWDFSADNRSNVIDVHMRRLREKIDRPFRRKSVETVRGLGYRVREDGR
jgi:two-component system OmpR family response regulator